MMTRDIMPIIRVKYNRIVFKAIFTWFAFNKVLAPWLISKLDDSLSDGQFLFRVEIHWS